MSSSWHVIHPVGDFFNRGAWFDSVLAGAVPVVFKEYYADYLPFADMLDYSRILKILPQVRLQYMPRQIQCCCSLLVLSRILTILSQVRLHVMPRQP